jgi:hypothetical protein
MTKAAQRTAARDEDMIASTAGMKGCGANGAGRTIR